MGDVQKINVQNSEIPGWTNETKFEIFDLFNKKNLENGPFTELNVEVLDSSCKMYLITKISQKDEFKNEKKKKIVRNSKLSTGRVLQTDRK